MAFQHSTVGIRRGILCSIVIGLFASHCQTTTFAQWNACPDFGALAPDGQPMNEFRSILGRDNVIRPVSPLFVFNARTIDTPEQYAEFRHYRTLVCGSPVAPFDSEIAYVRRRAREDALLQSHQMRPIMDALSDVGRKCEESRSIQRSEPTRASRLTNESKEALREIFRSGRILPFAEPCGLIRREVYWRSACLPGVRFYLGGTQGSLMEQLESRSVAGNPVEVRMVIIDRQPEDSIQVWCIGGGLEYTVNAHLQFVN